MTDRLGGVLGEEIGWQECSSNSGIEARITMVHRFDYRVLKSAWILQVQVNLTILRLVGLSRSRTYQSKEWVESNSHHLLQISSYYDMISGICTWPSVDSEVLTDPWGQPVPEVDTSRILIRSAEGPWRFATGLAKAKAGRRSKIEEYIFMDYKF